MLSDSFNIERGELQGDIFSPVCFIAGLDRIFRLHDVANSGMVVGEAESAILVCKFEYADDAALVDENAALASTRVTALATGSMADAAMLISIKRVRRCTSISQYEWTLPQRLNSQRSASLTRATRVNESSPSSEDSESIWLDGATAVVPNDHDLAR